MWSAARQALADLGRHHGGLLYEAEVRYLVAKEWAQTPDDILLRRTKHYLRLTEAETSAFSAWFERTLPRACANAAGHA